MSTKKTRYIKGIILQPDNIALDNIEGELKVDATSGAIKATLKDGANPSTERDVVTNSQTQTLTNKTLTSPVIDTSVSGTAIEADLAVSAASNKLAYAGAIKTYVDNSIAGKDQANEILTNPSISGAVGESVQTVLEEHEDRLDDLVTLSGVAANAENLGTFTGTTIPNNSNVKGALQALETAHEEVDQNVNDLITLSGVAENAVNLGTFTGTIIPDSSNVKGALQSLETHTESHTSASSNVHGIGATSSVVGTNTNQTLTTKTIDADNNTISNLQTSNLKSGVLNTSTSLTGASDTQIPSALAVKTYVDAIPSSIIVNQVSFTIANNQAAPANITGLLFNPATFRGIILTYSIYRESSTTSAAQIGELKFVYNTASTQWYLSDTGAGQDAGVEFSITNAGQIQYTSTSYGGTGYAGVLKYSLMKTFAV
jgi:predicted outer membrane protein